MQKRAMIALTSSWLVISRMIISMQISSLSLTDTFPGYPKWWPLLRKNCSFRSKSWPGQWTHWSPNLWTVKSQIDLSEQKPTARADLNDSNRFRWGQAQALFKQHKRMFQFHFIRSLSCHRRYVAFTTLYKVILVWSLIQSLSYFFFCQKISNHLCNSVQCTMCAMSMHLS